MARIEHRDYNKHPLTKAEVRKLAADGKRWSQRRLRVLVDAIEEAKRNPPKGGPRF